jgi:hypothetical protein
VRPAQLDAALMAVENEPAPPAAEPEPIDPALASRSVLDGRAPQAELEPTTDLGPRDAMVLDDVLPLRGIGRELPARPAVGPASETLVTRGADNGVRARSWNGSSW